MKYLNIIKVLNLLFLLLFKIILSTYKKIDKNYIINEPIFPDNTEELAVKFYNKSKFNLSHQRYNFQDKFSNRKIFKINYNYNPYINAPKNLSFEEYAIYIYNSTGMLNLTKLEFYYQNSNKIIINTFELNHIHISMSFNRDYTDLSLISIASILNTSNYFTYIHFHILGINFGIEEIKKIINLRKINKKVEFIFYNAKQAEYDFEIGRSDHRGVGNFAKILIPQIINNTNKILILDSGDILCQKDLSEIYYYDLEDNYFGWIMDRCAGNYHIIDDKFMSNNFHPNTGVLLVNIKLFRKDELYKKSVFMSKSYNTFKCPTQDILITISNYKFKFIPLNYNIHFYEKNQEFERYQRTQRFSPYKYSSNELLDALKDPVIYHFYLHKIQHNEDCNKLVFQWLSYANLTGVYDILKLKYPKPFKCE